MNPTEGLTAYVGAFVDELARSGLEHAVVSPGSRSTPLAMALQAHPKLKIWIHVDERSAGFFALGLAKALGKPTALLCTSGTAAANYFPAVVEANLARVPLVVLTADRPHELRDVGAPQAVDQLGMYGTHVKWFAEMALPEAKEPVLRYARTFAARAVGTSMAGPMGPVHLNFPFREPLVPDLAAPSLWERAARGEASAPYVRVESGQRTLPSEELDRWAKELSGMERGLIVCGPQDDPRLGEAVHRLAGALGFPVLADPLSQLRSGPHSKEWILEGYDAFLRDREAVETLAPEVVIRFGAMPVSKAYFLYLKAHPECRQIVVDPDGGWREPSLLATDMVYADPVGFCEGVVSRLGSDRKELPWSRFWKELNREVREILAEETRKDVPFEGRIFPELAELFPDNGLLFAGNSMPVRDMDSFFFNTSRSIRTMANRGANGIDGVVSTALGAAAAGNRITLVLGDLSFYHDLNGFLPAKRYGLDATVVVVNNEGGGIFSFLPQAGQAESSTFETLFGTPVGLDFACAVEMYGGRLERPDSWEAFRQAYISSLNQKGLTVIEVRTDRAENVRLHRRIWDRIARSVRSRLKEGDR
ncbi:2-succinyl-5-enolpyruvyl-6-hydroxy-3-cyclohexene-1-carboxylate synthase [Melghirimyces profundicolus]|uniref:2-succinyl-5-enolpyruvyl-6-hydroxy-3-cyclohexene-1-carboxylate synthase n=1 Tax=Melghirimyces profundicolus TaxID=1242148 RepID=A0A2T6C4W0_9BACL|nr:2-succinyl-5-enolpyruvyl-6-hydroxy-3-cyclohexene-1-carboxylic-acid synthase [Melghirimyces profundicolus]PTX63354.1 2-succinyl-5-enolpyruvyl-6-hydroxy-3-cyclohexene-1-carboxylate synthase [Melghirimyces profundicolus]